MSNVETWKKEFKEYVDGLYLQNDDYNGIMSFIDDVPVYRHDVLGQTFNRKEQIDYLTMCAGWSIKDDAISRVDVINAVHDEMYDEHTDKTGSLRLVMNVIGDMPTVENAPQWIPISEQMPPLRTEVLATSDGYVTIAEWLGGDEWFIQEGNSNATTEDIEAWTELPKPYGK